MTTQDFIQLQTELEQRRSALVGVNLVAVMRGEGAVACAALDELRPVEERLSAVEQAIKMSVALDEAQDKRLLDSTTLTEQRAICAAMINH